MARKIAAAAAGILAFFLLAYAARYFMLREVTVTCQWRVPPPSLDGRGVDLTFPDYPFWIVHISSERLVDHLANATSLIQVKLATKQRKMVGLVDVAGLPGPFFYGISVGCGEPDRFLPPCSDERYRSDPLKAPWN